MKYILMATKVIFIAVGENMNLDHFLCRYIRTTILLFGSLGLLIYSNNAIAQRTITISSPGANSISIYRPSSLTAEAWGAGGSGIGNRGAGGGGGAYSRKVYTSLTQSSFPYSVGAGTVNSNGESTWFISTTDLLARGGNAASAGTAGTGGATGFGDITRSGGNGFLPTSGNSGGGGGSSAGTGANGNNATTTSGASAATGGGNGGNGGGNNANGVVGSIRGGGGGGGGNGTTVGGQGGNGLLILTWNCSSALTSGNPNPAPVCLGTGIGPIVYDFIGASGYSINWVPSVPLGINVVNNDGTITIDGVPTSPGTFSYTISPTYPATSTGTCSGASSFTGSFTVNPNNTTTSASANQTACINAPLSNIIFNTTGATGISNDGVSGANGLPPGVSATWVGNTITITGTPTTTGTFGYTIPLTGGCGVVNATGTITVNASPAITSQATPGGTTCISGVPFGQMSVGTGFGYTYQWYSNDTQDYTTPTLIAGATSNIYIPLNTTSGTTYYYVTVSSTSCTPITSPVSAAYIVTPNNTAGTISSNTFCQGSALPAGVVQSTTGASGIGSPSGLPTGITASWATNQITFIGTPSVSGTFNYSIPLIGGCGVVSATGTITINAQAAILTPSLAAQTKCIGQPFAQISVGTGQGFTYQWYSNTTGSTSSGVQTPVGTNSNTYTPLSNIVGSTYYYVVVSSPTCGTTATSAVSGEFKVNPLPVVSFTAEPSGTPCVDADLTYTTQSGQSNYLWTIPGVAGADYTITSGGNATSNSLVIKWLTPGDKVVSVNYTDAKSCGATSPATSNSITIQKNTVTASLDPNPSSCYYDRAITTFTHTTTLATGIANDGVSGANGLPLGLSATWSGGIITISGTVAPSVLSGVYPYSILLTGGCGTVAATGFIDVQPEYTLSKITSVSPSNTGGNATITLTGNPSAFANGDYVVNYQMGLANPLSATNATVNFVNGVGTFFSSPINNESLTSLTINSIKKITDRCPVDIISNNITFFGIQPKIFDSNGTFYVPAGIFQITVKVYAGGGGGGRGSNGAGGGGGGYSEKTINVIPGEPIAIFVGNGGNGQSGSPATGGGPSYVTRDSSHPDPVNSSLAYAYGGIGAIGGTPGLGGVGLTTNGSTGNAPTGAAGGQGGKGGGTDGGLGGLGGTSGNAAATKGKAGKPFGGGGGGSFSNSDGGNGASGYVIITYPLPPVDPCYVVIDDGSKSGTTIIEYICDETWTAPEGLLEFTVLVGSGGGGGGSGEGSGGGGSGAVISQKFSTTNPYGLPANTTFEIGVGAGGDGATGVSSSGEDGEESSFIGTIDGAPINILVPGGGGGGSQSSQPGASGASGGGGGASRDNPLTPQSSGAGGSSISITYSGPFIFVYQGNEGGNGDAVDVPNKDAAIAGGGGGGLIPWKLPPADDGQNGKAAGLGQGEGGRGGDAVTLTLGDSIRYYGAGGGGIGEYFNGTEKIGEGGTANGLTIGGSGNLDIINTNGKGLPGRDKTGSGGGAGYNGGGKGGNGVVYITYDVYRILPVEFLYFNVAYQNSDRSGELKWSTAQEWETSHFEIERSVNDASNWKKVGEVTGKGYSDTQIDYSFIDENLPASGGNIYYRLKQVNLSGDFNYSMTRAIQVEAVDGSTSWIAYPNPSAMRSSISVDLLDRSGYADESILIRISDARGIFESYSVSSPDEVSAVVNSYLDQARPGLHILQLIWGNKSEQLKLIRN